MIPLLKWIIGDIMNDNTVTITADKIKKRNKITKILKIIILCSLLFLGTVYFILAIIFDGSNFTISLDPNLTNEKGITMYNDIEQKNNTKKLYLESDGFMDNISIDWLPKDIDDNKGGSHNGDNYIAYTFYIENQGEEALNYWYEISIRDVIKNVDEAIRIIVYRNGERIVYAKENADTKQPEPNTKKFNSEKIAVLESRTDFKPNDVDKFTIVFFLEGDDPDCIDTLIGGEIKMRMDIYEERKQKKEN